MLSWWDPPYKTAFSKKVSSAVFGKNEWKFYLWAATAYFLIRRTWRTDSGWEGRDVVCVRNEGGSLRSAAQGAGTLWSMVDR